MTHLTSTQRKLYVYLPLIVALVCFLFWMGRPAKLRVDETGQMLGGDSGGLLAAKRVKMGIADAQIGKIDPASTTMKLATFGLRGVAVSLLWYRANEFEKREDWNNVIATGNQIVLLEPNFVKMWEFLGWKYAYNASASFDDYRERYRWVIRGFNFICDGLRYNETSAKLYKNAGWTMSQKVGGDGADEREQYRRLLREDDEFGKRYDCPHPNDRDNWLLGRRWYHVGESLVRQGANIGKDPQFLYFSHARLNLFNYAKWKRKDGFFGSDAVKAWQWAQREWNDFAHESMGTAIDDGKGGPEYRSTLVRLEEINAIKESLTQELRAIDPGLYASLCLRRWETLAEKPGQQGSLFDRLNAEKPEGVLAFVREHLDATEPNWRDRLKAERDALYTAEQIELKKTPILLLNDADSATLNKGMAEISNIGGRSLGQIEVTPKVLSQEIQKLDIPAKKKARARQIIQEMDSFDVDARMSQLYRELLNYQYRCRESVVEQTDEVDQARRFEQEGRTAYISNQYQESNRLWLKAMSKWQELLDQPEFSDIWDEGTFTREILELVEKYVIILDADNEVFPATFGLQPLLRREVNRDGEAKRIRDAQHFAIQTFESGDFDKANTYFKKIISAWDNFNMLKECMKLAPLPEIRDSIVEAVAYNCRIQRKLGKTVPETAPLMTYVELMLNHDPLLQQGFEHRRAADAFLEESKPSEAEQEYAKALDAWKSLLLRYPMIIDQPKQASLYAGIRETVKLYEETLKKQEKDVPQNILPVE